LFGATPKVLIVADHRQSVAREDLRTYTTRAGEMEARIEYRKTS
jgi:hypothetical protein